MLGTALGVAVSCAAATLSKGMAVRARDEVVKSRWRSSGAIRNDMMADEAIVLGSNFAFGLVIVAGDGWREMTLYCCVIPMWPDVLRM
jgi:hypothetical protein